MGLRWRPSADSRQRRAPRDPRALWAARAFRRPGGAGLSRRIRLYAGLTLFAYVSLHLSNHALGIVSLSAMEAAQPYLIGGFRSIPGTMVLGGAALLHGGLALYTLYRRRQLRMPLWEAAQIALGFTIPLLLLGHVLATRISYELFATDIGYGYVVWTIIQEPWKMVQQTALLTLTWAHGCVGIHFWLRFRSWYPQVVGALYTVAIVLPLLALIGFLSAGREVARLDAEPRWHRAFVGNAAQMQSAGMKRLERIADLTGGTMIGAVLLVFAWRGLRRLNERRKGLIRIAYATGEVVTVVPGQTLLEISRGAGVPHASVCGGRSRCSTCRVRIARGGAQLPAPDRDEAQVLVRIKATDEVRLACQIRPTHDLDVATLFPVPPEMGRVRQLSDYHHGRELEITVMFADLRGFTTLVESQLPYDTVFLLNRYFAEMGQAIRAANGHLDKFIGDGVMALFGLDEDLTRGVTDALRAARAMSARLETVNRDLAHDLSEPLRIGIGIHVGNAVVGDMGWANALSLTAIGDTVNTASRIEGLTKRFDCELVVSSEVARLVGVSLDGYQRTQVAVRGRARELEVVIIPRAADMAVDV